MSSVKYTADDRWAIDLASEVDPSLLKSRGARDGHMTRLMLWWFRKGKQEAQGRLDEAKISRMDNLMLDIQEEEAKWQSKLR